LRELHERIKFTALYVTHDQEEALALSDRVAVMSEGKILQVASSAEIYKRPGSAFVARFLGDANLIDARVVAVDATACVVELLGSGATMGAAIPCGAAIRVGDSVQMVARPEALIVRSDSNIGAFPLLVQGRLCTRRFVGQDILAVVSTDVGADVNIRERPGGQLEQLSPGSPVSVVWRAPEEASVVPKSAEPGHVAAPEPDFG
jgi:ABC-type Fe3+/spermidine/putrescine transport system ATPase subunit